jgi:hypothetical protein
MTDLERATEQLYEAFEAYDEPDDLWIHPWDVDIVEPYWQKIQGKPLRRLTGFDLRWFAEDVFLVCGSVEAFKYYLPRMLELLGLDELGVTYSSVLSKLHEGDWKTWPEPEREAVDDWLYAWWIDFVEHSDVPDDFRGMELERRVVALGCAETSDRWIERYLNALHPDEHPERALACAELIDYRLSERGIYSWPWAPGFPEEGNQAYKRWLRHSDLREALEAVYLQESVADLFEADELESIADAVELLEIFESLET